MTSHIPYINKACIDKLPLTILMVLQRIQSNAVMIVCIMYKRKDNALQTCLCTLCDNGHNDDACEANHIGFIWGGGVKGDDCPPWILLEVMGVKIRNDFPVYD